MPSVKYLFQASSTLAFHTLKECCQAHWLYGFLTQQKPLKTNPIVTVYFFAPGMRSNTVPKENVPICNHIIQPIIFSTDFDVKDRLDDDGHATPRRPRMRQGQSVGPNGKH